MDALIDGGYRVWMEAGFAGLFVFVFLLFLGTILYYIPREQAKYAALVRETVAATAQTSGSVDKITRMVEEMTKKLDEKIRQEGEYMAYLKGRDAARGGFNNDDDDSGFRRRANK